jgi:trehalose 6-phosphate phosphatase
VSITAENRPAGLTPPPRGGHGDHALFLDVDGTLLEFADDPDGVIVAANLTDLLERLHRELKGALALISGRNLATIDRFFAPHRFAAAGLHGLELRDAAGHVTHFESDVEAMATLRLGMHDVAELNPGLIVEDKGGSLALHYRRVPLLGPIAAEEAQKLASRLGAYFVLQPGDHVVEIRPAGPDKGRALAALMATPPFAGRIPIAVGDDHTDEHAFDAAGAFGGYGVIVGMRRPTRAAHTLADPSAVHAWLLDFLDALQTDTDS